MWTPNINDTVDIIRYGVYENGRPMRGTSKVTAIRKVRGQVSTIDTESGDRFKVSPYGDIQVRGKGKQSHMIISAMYRHFNSASELRSEILKVLTENPHFMGACEIASQFGGDYSSVTDELIQMNKEKLVRAKIYDGECDWRLVEEN